VETAANEPRFGRAALAAAWPTGRSVAFALARAFEQRQHRAHALEVHAHLRALSVTERIER
jgi:hypothetical protein